MPSDQIDVSKIKVGDELTVTAKVSALEDEPNLPFPVQAIVGDAVAWIAPSDIISHTPKALEVGDRVRGPGGNVLEIVVARRGDGDDAQYGVWSDATGFIGIPAERVESWERLDAQ